MRTRIGQKLCLAAGLLVALSAAATSASQAQPPSMSVGESATMGSYLAISFSDGYASAARLGWPALSARGLRAVAFVPTAHVGEPNRMSVQDLTALAAAGWDIASHLDSHADCTQLPPEELFRRLAVSHNWLVEHGFAEGARIFGPPGLLWEPELTPFATRAGYKAIIVAREMGGIIPLDLDLVFAGCANKRPLNLIAAAIASAKAHPGTLLVLSFHNIVRSNPTGLASDLQRLNAVLDLAVASGLPIVTVSDLMGQIDPGNE